MEYSSNKIKTETSVFPGKLLNLQTHFHGTFWFESTSGLKGN